jgi:heparin binding hemagglutinin HbhA
MVKTKLDIPTQLPVVVVRPLYAGVGATDRVVEVVRAAVADARKRAAAARDDVQKTASGIDYQPKALRDQATKVVTARVDALAKDTQARRRAVEELLTALLQDEAQNLPLRLKRLVDGQVAHAGGTYDELVRRGETLVGQILQQPSTREATAAAKTTTAKAKTTRTQASKTATKAASSAKKTARKSPAKSSAKATATSAKKTASSAAEATTDAASKIGDSDNE